MTSKQQKNKVRKVMREFKAGTLKSSSGEPVANRKQAIAIALSQAGMSQKGKSDAYWDAYILAIEEKEEEGEMEDPEEEMDESAGEARCKGYLSALKKNAKKN